MHEILEDILIMCNVLYVCMYCIYVQYVCMFVCGEDPPGHVCMCGYVCMYL